MAARIAPCFGLGPASAAFGDQPVEHGLVEADLLGRHRAVVELVDAVGQLGGDLGLALGAAEDEDAVEGAQRGLALARQLGDERRHAEPTRPGLVKSRMAHRSPSPFSIGVPVRAMRVRAGMRRSCWAVSLAGFLMAWASSSTTRSHVDLARGRRRRGRRCRRW